MIADIARRVGVGARAADEPLQRERRVRVEHVVVADGELQQQVGIRVTANADAVAGAVFVVVGDEIRAGEGPGVAFGAHSAGDFDFADGERDVDDGLRELRSELP